MRRPLLLLASLPLALVSLAACGSELTPTTVANGAEHALAKRLAGLRPAVSCPHSLDAEVGARTRCSLTADGLDGTYGVTVTVTKVEGKTADFDVKVDDKPAA